MVAVYQGPLEAAKNAAFVGLDMATFGGGVSEVKASYVMGNTVFKAAANERTRDEQKT